MGIVYLIGGGPGNPELITVKGLQILKEADCVIYDRLVAPELLKDTKKECERIYVGKENHHHTMKQEEINALLVKKAQEYSKVVRLKGGDVYVFGRGGEEGIYLHEHGIKFEVVPGISSSIAGLAYAGIPITHRGIAGGFHVVTAHNKRDELADIDFRALANTNDTCVFLMGLSKLKEIMNRLIEAGKPEGTKAAVIAHATLPDQKTIVGTIDNIDRKVKQANLTSPALIVVGEVIALREKLNFLEESPLFGHSYLLPRIGGKKSELAQRLRENGAKVNEFLIGRIHFMPEQMKDFVPENYSWIILTSKNGVESFFQGLKKEKIDNRRLAGIKFAVVGKATADYLKTFGIYADFVPEQFDSNALWKELSKILTKEDSIFYGKAEGVEEEWIKYASLRCKIRELPLYRNERIEEEKRVYEIFSKRYDGILFTCSSAAERTIEKLEGQELNQLLKHNGIIVSIGEKTSNTLKHYKVNNFIQAKEATYMGILESCLNMQTPFPYQETRNKEMDRDGHLIKG